MYRDRNRVIFNNLGVSLGRLGQYDDAFRAFKEAGDEATAYNNLGRVYMAKRKYGEDLECFQKAFETSPGYYAGARDNIERAKSALQQQNRKKLSQNKKVSISR